MLRKIGVRLCGARLLSVDMWFASVLGFRSFFDWLRGEVICIGGVGVADAGVIGRFIEILAVSGFEFGFGGLFFCRAELEAGAHEFGGVEGLGFFAVNLILTQQFQQLGAVLRGCFFHCGEGGFYLCDLALHLWNVFIVGAF